MIGYIHLQIDLRYLLILNFDLWYLQRGFKLRIVEGPRSICLDAHHSFSSNIPRLERLQLVQTNVGSSKLRVVSLLPRPNAHLALHVPRGKLDPEIAVNFFSSAVEAQGRRGHRLV